MGKFKSKEQYEKFKELEKNGKLPKGTVRMWTRETGDLSKLKSSAQNAPFKVKKVKVI